MNWKASFNRLILVSFLHLLSLFLSRLNSAEQAHANGNFSLNRSKLSDSAAQQSRVEGNEKVSIVARRSLGQ